LRRCHRPQADGHCLTTLLVDPSRSRTKLAVAMVGLVKLTVCAGVLLLIRYAVSPPLVTTYGRRIYGQLTANRPGWRKL
jgi:hypothetical protein